MAGCCDASATIFPQGYEQWWTKRFANISDWLVSFEVSGCFYQTRKLQDSVKKAMHTLHPRHDGNDLRKK
jgi:hypothetical protein